MTEKPRFAVVLGIPVIGEFDERCVAAGSLALLYQRSVARRREEDEGVAALFALVAADLAEPKLVAIKIECVIEIAYA
jgi:hypothetical protein